MMKEFYQVHSILCWYLLAINGITFFAFAIDKLKAKLGRWRIPEKTLLILAFVGGAVGGYAAMWIFRHKIRKAPFYIGVPAMIVLHVILLSHSTRISGLILRL